MANRRANINVGKLYLEEVSTSMNKPCWDCVEEPDEIRLVQVIGSGRWAKTYIRCDRCGFEYLTTDLVKDLKSIGDELVDS